MKIAYKATYNFKCLNQLYEVGYSYKASKLDPPKYGISYCSKMEDVIKFYPHNETFILLEIEVLGDIAAYEDDQRRKVTDHIKVLRVVPESEYNFSYSKCEYDDRGNMIECIDPNPNSNGKSHLWEYDDQDNVTKTVFPNGDTYLYEYDDRGNVIKVVYPDGKIYTYPSPPIDDFVMTVIKN